MKNQISRPSFLGQIRSGPINGSATAGHRRPLTASARLVNGPSRLQSSLIRIIVVDDHPITVTGLESLLSRERDFTVVARCMDGVDAIRAVRAHAPDLLVVDQDMPVMDGVAVLRHLRTVGDRTPLVLFATANNQKLAEALKLQVNGVVFKHSDPRQLIRCLREVHAGRRWFDANLKIDEKGPSDDMAGSLTPRQLAVARAAASGLSNKELAQRLGVSEGTIKNHLHAIYERLNLDGRLALLLYLKEKATA